MTPNEFTKRVNDALKPILARLAADLDAAEDEEQFVLAVFISKDATRFQPSTREAMIAAFSHESNGPGLPALATSIGHIREFAWPCTPIVFIHENPIQPIVLVHALTMEGRLLGITGKGGDA